MSDCPYEPRLSAYHDGELSPQASRELDGHVAGCAVCARHLADLRELSRLMAGARPRGEISPAQVSRLHEAIDQPDDRPLLRLGFGLSAAAASVLIVSLAWLSAAPREKRVVVIAPAPQAQWERLAALEPQAPPGDSETEFADATKWMLDSLKQGMP